MTQQSGGAVSGAAGGILGGTYPSPTYASGKTTPTVNTASAVLGTNHAMSAAGAWDTLASVVVGAGTWLVVGIAFGGDSASVANISARLFDGTTAYGGAELTTGGANFRGSLPVAAIITTTGTTTISLQGRTSIGTTTTFFASTSNGLTPGACSLVLEQVG